MIPLLQLRLKQFVRIIQEIGLPLILIGLFAVSGFLFSAWASIRVMPEYSAIGAVALLVISIDYFRKDKAFIQQVFGQHAKMTRYFFFEYSLAVFPILIFQSIRLKGFIVLGILVAILLIAFISPNIVRFQKTTHKKSFHWIPLKYFELKFFFEQKPIMGFLIFLCLFGGVLHISLWILGMVMWVAIIGESFTPMEPVEMLNKGFLVKLKDYLILILSLNCFPIIPILLIHPSQWYVLLYGFVSLAVVVSFMISYKYANYNGLTQRLFSAALPSVFMFLTLIPGFIIVTALMAIYYFFKAQKNLSYAST